MHTIRDIVEDRVSLFVKGDQSVREVVDYLCEHKVGAVAVKEEDEIIGVFSERDLMLRVVHKGLDPQTVAVREVMSPGCLKVPVDEDYRVAKMHMFDRGVRHLVVVDDADKFLGLISMRDMIEMDVKEYSDLVSKLNDRYYQVALKTEKS